MTEPVRQIPPERKALYYGGMATTVAGVLLFVSNFCLGPRVGPLNDPQPGDADFWDQVQKRHAEFGRGMEAVAVRAVGGMALCVVGGIMMSVGARGAAGSGLVLDPEKARKDLEPWSRMAGGVVGDALAEVGAARPPDAADPPPVVKVRCRACQALNDEAAKFCNQCGAAV